MATWSSRRNVWRAVQSLKRHGAAATATTLAIKTTNAFLPMKVLRACVFESPLPEFTQCPEPFRALFLDSQAVRTFARNPEYEMQDGFLEQALARGDECFAICDGDTLAAYGWYSNEPTRIDPPELEARFDQRYMYAYKGFTHPSYRGRRLHGFRVTMALCHFISRGYTGLIAYIEANNLESLKASFRAGYVPFGSVYLARVFGRWIIAPSRGCRRLGFQITPYSGDQSPSGVRLAS